MLPSGVVGQVVSVGRPALRLSLVDRIVEERPIHDAGHITLRVQKVRVGQVETAANFVGQGRGRRPAPGQRHQVGMGRVGGRRDGPVVVRNVRPVRVIAIVRVSPAHRVARGDVVINFAGQVVEQLVIALVEPVATGVAAVADIRIVDGCGHLRQDGLHARIHPGQTPEREQVHLVGDAARIVSENPVARIGSKNSKILRHLLVRADGLVAGVEEQLVLADGSADVAAELILIEERPPDAGLVVEPVVGREVVVAVVPENLAVKLVAAAGRGKRRLRGAARCRRRGVRSYQRHLPNLPHAQPVGRVIQRIVANVIVLYVDAVQRHVGVTGAQTVDHRIGVARNHASLGLHDREDVAVQNRQVLDLLHADRGRDLGGGRVDALRLGRHFHALCHTRQFQLDARDIGLARYIHRDPAQRRLEESFGRNREIVFRRPHADEVIQSFGGSPGYQQRLLPAGEIEFHAGPAHRGARSVYHRARDAAGHLRIGGNGQKQGNKQNPTHVSHMLY